jgi:predicted enzyme related to lactoylglutathione lyase
MADVKKGTITWFEIYVDDMERAKRFYNELFGWQFSQMEGAPTEYWMVNTGEGSPGGGFMKRSDIPGAPPDASSSTASYPQTVLYPTVDNLAETLAKAERLGGTTLKPPTLIDAENGSFAILQDSERNALGLWSTEVIDSERSEEKEAQLVG